MLEKQKEYNWAGNYTYTAASLHYPETIEQVQNIIHQAKKVRTLGSRHSFNAIADTLGDQISLERFDQTNSVAIDQARHTVTVAGGVRYGQLCQQLDRAGYALPNLASLPHISIAGACATATHGSGEKNGNLATVVSALEIVTASGEIVTLSREHDGDQFLGAVVGLGGLGVVTHLTLDLKPRFEMRQDVYENMPLAQMESHFDDLTALAYSTSFFTDWRHETFAQVWLKRQIVADQPIHAEPTLFGATLAHTNLHPLPGISAVNCTAQMGVPGPWYERLPHFRMDFTPSSGEELQSEYLVPRRHAIAAIRAMMQLSEHISPLLQISELRTIAADELWMSMCYQQESVGFHFTWLKNWEAVQQVLPLIEAALAPFNARPHWGKLFTMPAARIQALYTKLPDFQQLLTAYDPAGKFRNAFVDTYIFGA